MPAGAEFRRLIFQKVRECDVFGFALSLGKRVVPVLIDATAKPPASPG